MLEPLTLVQLAHSRPVVSLSMVSDSLELLLIADGESDAGAFDSIVGDLAAEYTRVLGYPLVVRVDDRSAPPAAP